MTLLLSGDQDMILKFSLISLRIFAVRPELILESFSSFCSFQF